MSLLYSVAGCTQISILPDWVEFFLDLLVILCSLLICSGASPLCSHLAAAHSAISSLNLPPGLVLISLNSSRRRFYSDDGNAIHCLHLLNESDKQCCEETINCVSFDGCVILSLIHDELFWISLGCSPFTHLRLPIDSDHLAFVTSLVSAAGPVLFFGHGQTKIQIIGDKPRLQNESLNDRTWGEVTDWRVKATATEICVVAVVRLDLEESKFNIGEMVQLTRV
jgi:hypothetical protein